MKLEGLRVNAGELWLDGDLSASDQARALVVFAHGSGSSRHSPRNREVASALNDEGLATLLFDLLSPAEEAEDSRTARLRFDIDLLAQRLANVVLWMQERDRQAYGGDGRPVGLFGASTGAAAALVAAARLPDDISAVVSRGGRPDLAADSLESVRAPTLLIVGGRDVEVLSYNERAAAALDVEHDVALVPRAGHLFEESGAMETVSRLTSRWFSRHLLPDA